jgi:radical SAM protein with 4Fe4S-binding SPASM domain
MRPSLGWMMRFFQSFICGDTASMPPLALTFDVTRKCNLHCRHCRLHSPLAPPLEDAPGSDFPLDQFHALCRDAKAWGVIKIIFIGEGEPLLHPGLTEMVAAAKETGFQVILLTNGTLLQAHHAEVFVKAGLDELRISLWASDEEEFRALYPGSNPKLFHRALAGARLLAAAKRERRSPWPRVILHRPIESRFFRRIDGTLRLARETGCEAVSFSPLKPLLPRDQEHMLSPAQEQELRPLLVEVGRKARAAGLEHNIKEVLFRFAIGRAVWEKLPCYIGWTNTRIRVNGDVVPCDTCNWVMGNINRQPLRDIWNGPEYREFRRLGRRLGGIGAGGRACICDFCCHILGHARIHRVLKWVPGADKTPQEART